MLATEPPSAPGPRSEREADVIENQQMCPRCRGGLEKSHHLVGLCYWCLRERDQTIDWEKEAKHYRSLCLQRTEEMDDLLASGLATWQAIGSAPRDGTKIWLWSRLEGMFIGFRNITNPGGDWGWAHENYDSCDAEPTYWMPLPTPPSAEGGE